MGKSLMTVGLYVVILGVSELLVPVLPEAYEPVTLLTYIALFGAIDNLMHRGK